MVALNYRDPGTQQWVPLPHLAGQSGAAGPTGVTGPTAVSTDPGNAATIDPGDGGIFVAPATQAETDLLYVNVAGDTMTGELILPDQIVTPPSVSAAASAKGYVDQIITVSDVAPDLVADAPSRDGLIWTVVIDRPWAPSDIPGLGTWLEADSITAVDGDPVTGWSDGSGNGFSVVATGTPPIWRQVGIGGQPSIEFGPNTPLTVQGWGTAASGKAEFTMFHVISATNRATWPVIMAAPTDGPFQWLAEFEPYGVIWGQPDSTRSTQFSLSDDPPGSGQNVPLLTYSMHPINGPSFYCGGAPMWVVTSSGGGLAGPLPQLGPDVLIGAAWDGTVPLAGQIAAILWYDRCLSDAERLQVETYLSDKYVI